MDRKAGIASERGLNQSRYQEFEAGKSASTTGWVSHGGDIVDYS
jgi:hypothetical protein